MLKLAHKSPSLKLTLKHICSEIHFACVKDDSGTILIDSGKSAHVLPLHMTTIKALKHIDSHACKVMFRTARTLKNDEKSSPEVVNNPQPSVTGSCGLA